MILEDAAEFAARAEKGGFVELIAQRVGEAAQQALLGQGGSRVLGVGGRM